MTEIGKESRTLSCKMRQVLTGKLLRTTHIIVVMTTKMM